MIKKIPLVVLAALSLALLLTPACTSGKQVVGLGQEFQLRPGQQASITGQDISIELVRVTEDSRCPTGVT
jgi:hypothetical protein